MSVDQIYDEVRRRAFSEFNRECAARQLGHEPTNAEAMKYFLATPTGYKDALRAIGAEEPFSQIQAFPEIQTI